MADNTTIHYSSDGWTFVWSPPQGAIEISSGFVQGAFASETRETPTYSSVALLKGGQVRVHNANKAVMVAFVMDSNHPIHRQLIELADLDTDEGPRNVVGNIKGTLVGPDGTVVKTKEYVNAYIETHPDESEDITSTPVTWNFKCSSVKKSSFRNNAEIVGAA